VSSNTREEAREEKGGQKKNKKEKGMLLCENVQIHLAKKNKDETRKRRVGASEKGTAGGVGGKAPPGGGDPANEGAVEGKGGKSLFRGAYSRF